MSYGNDRNGRFGARRRAVGAAGAAVVTAAGMLVGSATPGASLEPVTPTDSTGDFETVGLTPQGWGVYGVSPNRAVVSTSRAISGTRSLLVEDSSTSAATIASRNRFAITPGGTYFAQGYAYTTKGLQNLSVIFYDAKGAVVGRTTTPTTGAAMVWSRVEVRATAPATATTASIQVFSTNAAVSQVWWDGLSIIRPLVPNDGFEAAPTATSPVPGWGRWASGGAAATVTTSQARLGGRSLQVTDTTGSGAATAISGLTQVFPGVTHDLRGWVRPTAGSFVISVRWYDASRRFLGIRSFPVYKPANQWSLVRAQVTAPYNATLGAVQINTTVAGTGSGTWDAMGLSPALGAPLRGYSTASMGEPLDAFSNSNTSGTTVVAGRPKLFTVISGYPGEFQLADVQTGTIEAQLPMPGMEVGWAVTVGRDGAIYVGGGGGHLWRYVPGAAAMQDLGKPSPSASTIWDLKTGPDGKVWGVSYPSSELWSYDTGYRTFNNLGTVSAAHAYARSVAVDSSYAYVGLGSTNPTIMRVSLANPTSKTTIPFPTTVTTGNVPEMQLLGRYLEVQTPAGAAAGGGTVSSERRLYDTRTGSWDVAANMAAQTPSPADANGKFYYLSYKQLWAVDSTTGAKTSVASTAMAAGRDRLIVKGTLGGVSGEWLLAYDPAGKVAAINLATFQELSFPVTFRNTKMKIKSLNAGPNGTVYAGGFGGPALTVVDPATGGRQQYPGSVGGSGVIGEMEGTKANGSFQYLGTYTDGKIFRYDTTRPWANGTNPAPIATLGPTQHQDRPLAWAASGTRTFFGTIPKYGVLGGDLGIIDNDTAVPRTVSEPVTDQSVVALAASGDVVYGGTSRWGGLGSTPTQSSAKVFAYDTATNRKLWESTPLYGAQAFGAVAIGPNGSLWAANGPMLFELDPRTGAVLRKVMIYPAPATTGAVYRNADLAYVGGLLYVAAMDRIYAVDPATLRVTAAVPSGVSTPQLAVQGSRIYYAAGTQLRYLAIS